jgi:hypothetical protein
LDNIDEIIKLIAEFPCDHKQDLKRLDEINSLQKSVANLRKDIPAFVVKLLVDAENRRVLLS